jgi:ribosome maturation factor RimP
MPVGALEEVRDLAEAVARRRSLSVWDIEMAGQPGRSIVKVYVTAENGGPDLDTVAQVSEEISRGLDLKDPIPGRYTLEVSTPGLERNLRTSEHFTRSIGEKVSIKTRERLHDNSHRIDGTITAAGADSIELDVNGTRVTVPLDQVRAARTVFEW